jgi:dTDP-4-dehydrorhamnose 3,5-epimerase-like enzyme
MWNDDTVGIEWPEIDNMEVLLSEKDKVDPMLIKIGSRQGE